MATPSTPRVWRLPRFGLAKRHEVQGTLLKIVVPDVAYDAPYFLRIRWDDHMMGDHSPEEVAFL